MTSSESKNEVMASMTHKFKVGVPPVCLFPVTANLCSSLAAIISFNLKKCVRLLCKFPTKSLHGI